ncbi:MAG: nicotinamide riboside transporter PnuC [Candidatus Nanoarchaeia archaeon]|nr:nicotinamide riboside transporter PnuC [Candidatus Nanoarchaeia archaeon]MDD5740472.1 nicotinamide riboside transporter PnuC [Candidatus Nanoarchaeia archaeon]
MLELMTILELAAVILGVLSVYFTTKQNIWCWPTGIAMTILYVIIFLNVKLYSDTLENFIYIFMQIYGWYYWVYGNKKKKDSVPVKRLKIMGIIFWSLEIIVVTMLLGYVMANYTGASLPYWDSLTTVMSLTAQWLMGRKILENWVLWISVDVMALFIYSYKGLYMTTGLYAVFLVLATSGLIKWYRSYKTQNGK